MGKMLRRMGCFLLVSLVATLLCLHSSSSAKVHSGTWGTNTKWYYDTKTKTVVIDCEGRMDDNSSDHGPTIGWGKFYMKAKKVIFKSGITYIGTFTFDNFQKLEKVVLPEGLVSIGAYAFEGTINLKKVKFPTTMRTIGRDAFDGSGIEALSLSSIEKIGSSALSGTNIKRLKIPLHCQNIESYAFSSCFKLQHVKIENGIKTISTSMFSRTGIETITIPASVTKIGTRALFAFSPEESKLKRVTINSTKIKKWGKNIFGNARKDLVIRVPKSKKKEYTKALREGGLPEYVKIVGK